MEKYLIYAHASANPPPNIKLNTWYSFEELKQRFSLEEIKAFFNPTNFQSSELDDPKVEIKKSNKE